MVHELAPLHHHVRERLVLRHTSRRHELQRDVARARQHVSIVPQRRVPTCAFQNYDTCSTDTNGWKKQETPRQSTHDQMNGNHVPGTTNPMGEQRAPAGVLKPFSYLGCRRRLKGVSDAPHMGCCRLLQVPSKVRYLWWKHMSSHCSVRRCAAQLDRLAIMAR